MCLVGACTGRDGKPELLLLQRRVHMRGTLTGEGPGEYLTYAHMYVMQKCRFRYSTLTLLTQSTRRVLYIYVFRPANALIISIETT